MVDGGARTALPRYDTGHSDLYVGFVDAAKERRAPESESTADHTFVYITIYAHVVRASGRDLYIVVGADSPNNYARGLNCECSGAL